VNIGIEAIVRDVAPDGARIVLTYIDQNNQETTISDFGRDNKLEIRIFNYLLSRKGNKAIFIVTIKPRKSTQTCLKHDDAFSVCVTFGVLFP